uniref:Olfactory receptor n=1 Tax=Camelus bactrianus TaxID=9837 RepID=A0A9W3G4H9_CAMBA|nr:olfactory receptor 51G2-like [Camelus bactrianus]
MSLFNGTHSQPPFFLLSGIPGLEASHTWISIPLSIMYVIAILGNGIIVHIVHKNPSLHEPQYVFLSMLAATNTGMSTSALPTVLNVFLLNHREIEFHSCLAQMFFIYTCSSMESAMLLAMAFDRFVAIRNPLHYTAVLTHSHITQMGLIILGNTITNSIFSTFLPLPILLRGLCFCHSNVLSHSYCLHPDILKLSCSSTKINSTVGLFVVLSTMGLDFLLILFSYVLILKTVLSIASHGGRLKALNTCISHLSAVILFFTPMIGLSILHRFGPKLPAHVYVTMANMHFLIPPVMNPIVYVVKTKQIRDKILKLVIKKGPGESQVTFIT